MLSVKDLVDIEYIPAEEEISLQLLVDFYEEYLCKRIFIYTLKNGRVIKLFFRDATEIFHVSGIDHIYEGVPMDGTRFLQGIKDDEIDLETVENINAAAYKDYIARIRSMACLDTIIKKCEYLWFPSGEIPDTKIEVKYLLLKGLDGKNLHLGIDTYNEKRPYYSKTLLVTEGNSAEKFIDKADERLRVVKLEIRDKDTDKLLVCVDRKGAERNALGKIRNYVEGWFLGDFQRVIMGHLMQTVSRKIFEKWSQMLCSEMLFEMIAFDSEIETAFEMRESEINDVEWKELFLGIFEEKLLNSGFVEGLLHITMQKIEDYEQILHDGITRSVRDEWKAKIKSVIDEKRSEIRGVIELMDCYTPGIILGEVVRKYEKEELRELLNQKIVEFIDQKGRDVVRDILRAEIIQQKEKVMKKVATLLC